MILRPYQEACVTSILTEFVTHPATLAVLATGCGKTVIFSELIRRQLPQRAMVLAHRKELVLQAKSKIESIAGIQCDVEMGDSRAHTHEVFRRPVVVSTVQSQISGADGSERMRNFDPMEFSLLICDEAHHCASNSWRKIINYYQRNPNLRVLGVTATPDRTDELALGEIFGSVAFDYEILDAIHEGYLVPIDQQFVSVGTLDFSSVRTTAGDLNGADLARVMESEENMHSVSAAAIQIIGDKRTLIFTASVAQAETLCNILNRHKGGMAGWVCGKTPTEERAELLSDFSNGKIQVMVNCAVLTEGFDSPGVEIVIMAKPTKSRALYAQMIGRGTRTLPGVIDAHDTSDARKEAIKASTKPSLLVLDFIGNSGRHKLMSAADILGGKSSEEAIELAIEKAKKKGGRESVSVLLDEAEEEIRSAQLQKRENERLQEAARKAKLMAQAQFKLNAVDPFARYDVRYQAANDWDKRAGRMLTEGQRKVLVSMGVNPDKVSVSCGKQMVGAYFNNPSPKQIVCLTRAGYDCTGMTKKDASKAMDELVKNNWQRPTPPT